MCFIREKKKSRNESPCNCNILRFEEGMSASQKPKKLYVNPYVPPELSNLETLKINKIKAHRRR